MRIDLWTLALQTLNVVVLIWLLAHFLFRPVAAIIAARRDSADRLLADAEATRAAASADAAALATARAQLAEEARQSLATARKAAEAERAALLQQAAASAARLQTDAHNAAARDASAMRAALEQEATQLALTIATRLLQRVPPQALTRAFAEMLADTLATHPDRASLHSADLELRSALPLDAAAQADCVTIIGRALGGTPRISFRTDPTLLAGLDLAAPHLLVRNSWRADLDRITRSLHEDAAHDIAQHVA